MPTEETKVSDDDRNKTKGESEKGKNVTKSTSEEQNKADANSTVEIEDDLVIIPGEKAVNETSTKPTDSGAPQNDTNSVKEDENVTNSTAEEEKKAETNSTVEKDQKKADSNSTTAKDPLKRPKRSSITNTDDDSSVHKVIDLTFNFGTKKQSQDVGQMVEGKKTRRRRKVRKSKHKNQRVKVD